MENAGWEEEQISVLSVQLDDNSILPLKWQHQKLLHGNSCCHGVVEEVEKAEREIIL